MTILINDKKTNEKDDLDLFEDLERRFGPAMAQQIMDELKKAENPNKKVAAGFDYMGAKALSEGAELYRHEAQHALERLKTWKRRHVNKQHDIVEWDGAFLQRQFERKHRFYMRFHKSYFILYRQAIDAYRLIGVTASPYKEVRHDQAEQTSLSQAA